jgi:hypothetical protein
METETRAPAQDASDATGPRAPQDQRGTRLKRTFKIYRYDPDTGRVPEMQSITIELGDSERMLLDALYKLKEIDPTLSFRRSCREGSAARTA